jgi:hypothetical protein
MILAIIFIIGAFIGGFLVGRNNPNLSAVNKIISTGKAVVDKTGKIVSVIKS